jgi:ribosomal protein L37AE/L43A
MPAALILRALRRRFGFCYVYAMKWMTVMSMEAIGMGKKKKKTPGGTPGRNGTRCPYCGSPVVLRSADGIYHENKCGAKLYVCSRYPACDAYVRIREGSKNIPMGSMANGELRALRIEAHRCFDRIHQSGLMSRQDAYAWLAGIVSAPLTHAHIGQLGEYYCKVVIDESKKFLNSNKEKALRMNLGRGTMRPMAGGDRYAAQHGAAAAGRG